MMRARSIVLSRHGVSASTIPLLVSLAEEVEAALFAGAPWTAEQAQSFAARLERFRTATQDLAVRPALPPLNPAR